MTWMLLFGLAHAQDDDVLLVGNSYTSYNGLAEQLALHLGASVPGWPDPTTRSITAGGETLAGHLQAAENPNNMDGLFGALVGGDDQWDTVILQDQSQIPGFYQDNGAWLDSLDGVVGLNALVEAHGADTALFLTWGRRNGDNSNPTLYPDFSTMQDRLTDGYLTYAAEAGTNERPVTVLPVGEAWRKIHDDTASAGDPLAQDSLFVNLYSSDGSHPSGVGTALISMTFTAGLSGRSAVVLPSLEKSGLDAATQQVLIEAANSVTLNDPFGPWDFSWVHPFENWQGAIDSDGARPFVWLDTTATVDSLTLGDGQLHILQNGSLTLEALSLRDDSTLALQGTLDVDDVVGDLHLPQVGTLVLGNPETTIDGTATVDGTVVMTHELPAGTSSIVLTATELIVGETAQFDLPPGYAWEQDENEIRVRAPGGGGCGCTSSPASPLSLTWLGLLAGLGGLLRSKRLVRPDRH